MLLSENRRGKMCDMRGLMVGREVYVMAMLISTADQMAAPTPSTMVGMLVWLFERGEERRGEEVIAYGRCLLRRRCRINS